MRPFVSFVCLLVFVSIEAASADGRGRGVGPGLTFPPPVTDEDYHDAGRPDPDKVELGRLLFFDKILSGNENISCATCHHPLTFTGDGLSLPVGEGGNGLGVGRDTGQGSDAVLERVPRNAPHVFNLGAIEFERMFHDGRVEVDPSEPSGFRSPAGALLPADLDSALAAQAMFPVTSSVEMAGQSAENPVGALAASGDLVGVWDALAARLQAIPEYVSLFASAFPEIAAGDDITFAHAANAIAAFEASAWRADDSPFDRFLRGDRGALGRNAFTGARLFYGKAGCSECHAGPFQTDHAFHAIAMPQIGPGKGDDADGHSDFGRERETGDAGDRFRFRTPSLRNVALTGPWGHAGAFDTLRAVVEHHFDPVDSFWAWDPSRALFPPRDDLDAIDFVVMSDPARRGEIAAANELHLPRPRPEEIDRLLDFLHALTDPASLDLRADAPLAVPSGLPVVD